VTELHEALVYKNPVNFWKTWKNKISKTNGNKIKIEGNLSNHEEVKQFAQLFSETCSLNTLQFNKYQKTKFINEF